MKGDDVERNGTGHVALHITWRGHLEYRQRAKRRGEP
jgi:hypothetical protein